jgi:hypothetical protein
MNNFFKQNSRFSSLIEENNDYKQINKPREFKEDKEFKEYKEVNKFKQFDNNKTVIRKTLEITEDNFPELSTSKKYQENSKHINSSFLDKVNTKKKEECEEGVLKEPKIEDGWVEFKYDIKTRKVIKNYSKNILKNNMLNNSNNINFYTVLDHLVGLHKKRTEEYINNWGEDEYEKQFIFPNYEYGYFDILDAKEYEKEQKEKEKQEDEDYYYNYDYYDE